MADPKSFAEQYMPNLDPATLAQWTQRYNPAAPAPGTIGPPAPARDPMAAALAAANAKPGAPPPAAPAPSLFDRKFTPVDPNAPTPAEQAAATRQPRNGDWAGHNEFQQKLALDKAQANLDGATFYDPKKGTAAAAPGTPGGALVKVSNGGRTPASWTTQTQEGVKLSPETYRAANKADASARDAAMWERRAGEEEADRDFSYLEQFSKRQETHANQLAERAEKQRVRYEAQLAKLEKMTAAAEGDEIDPGAFFTKHGTAGAFAAGLAYIGGAFGAALQGPGAVNQGMQAVRNSIQQEIDAQKANASLHRQKLEDQRTLLGQMAKTFGDEREAEEAAWIVYLQKAKTDMAKNAAAAKTDQARAKWRAGLSILDQQLAGRFEKWDQLTKDHVVRTQHDVNAPAQYVGGAGAAPLDKTDRKEVQDIAEQMEKAGIPQAYSNLQDVDRTIDTLGNGEIEGQSWTADKVFGVSPQLGKALYGDQAVAGRQAMATIKNGIRKSIAGASLTEGEKVELDKQLEGAKDAASLRRVVESARQAISHRARNIMTNGSDKARTEYSRRFGAAGTEGGPFTAMPGKATAPHVKEAK